MIPSDYNFGGTLRGRTEYTEEISLYDTRYHDMVGKTMPGMPELLDDLKAQGYNLYGLTNWSYKACSCAE